MLFPLARAEKRQNGISFRRAPRVTPGEPVASRQLRGLADAWNDRLRSGIGDCSRRIGYYFRNAFYQIRNPDGTLYPPIAEFYQVYQQAQSDELEWPDTGPGDPAGANLASLLPAYVYGAEAADLYDEGTRLSDPTYGGMLCEPVSSEPRDLWELGKAQRGAYDPDTGGVNCPAFTAARSYGAIRFTRWTPHGNAYGSFVAQPEILAAPCEDPDASDDYPAPINYEIKFESLRDGYPDLTYPGTCQDGPSLSVPGMYDSHVYAIGYSPWSYYVVLNDGTVQELSRLEYLEGPYSGAPKLSRTWGSHLERMFQKYLGDFRGTDQNIAAMRDRPPHWNKRAFDFRRFIRSQYLLAPARGVEVGSEIAYTYQHLSVSGSSKTLISHEDCVFSSFLIDGAGTVRALSGDSVVANGTSQSSKVVTIEPAVQEVRFESQSPVQVEVLEQMNYRPHIYDWLLVLRIGAARL